MMGNKSLVVAAAYAYFIRKGKPGTDSVLVVALRRHGDKSMAEDFLNSGKAELKRAGRSWAKKHVITSYRVGVPSADSA